MAGSVFVHPSDEEGVKSAEEKIRFKMVYRYVCADLRCVELRWAVRCARDFPVPFVPFVPSVPSTVRFCFRFVRFCLGFVSSITGNDGNVFVFTPPSHGISPFDLLDGIGWDGIAVLKKI